MNEMAESEKPILNEKLLDMGIAPVFPHAPTGFNRYRQWQQMFASERFLRRLWGEFRDRTGHWPVRPMVLHYAAWLWLLLCFAVGILAGVHYGGRFTLLGISAGVCIFVAAEVYWRDAALLYEWRRFRLSQNPNEFHVE